MKLSTKIKLLFSKKLRNKLCCCDCGLCCHGKHIIKKEEICDIRIYNYEHRKEENDEKL